MSVSEWKYGAVSKFRKYGTGRGGGGGGGHSFELNHKSHAASKIAPLKWKYINVKRLTAAIVSFTHCNGLNNSKTTKVIITETSWKVNSFYGWQKLFWRERSPQKSCFLKPYTRPLFTFCSLRAYLGWFTCKFLYTFMYRSLCRFL